MALKFRITAGTGAQNPNAANVVVRAGVCSAGVPASPSPPGLPYQYDAGQDPTPDLGYGPLCASGLYGGTFGGSPWIALKIPATTAGTISAVTKPGGSTSPTPTIAGSTFDSVTNSPFDAFSLAFRYSTGGLPGTAVVDVALDGSTFAYTFPIPPELPATLRGSVDITGITWSSLNNLTLRWKVDGGGITTVTFGTVAAEADVLAAFTTATIAAAFVQVGDKRYLEVYGATKGTTGALDFCGGSAEDLLGFTPAVAVQRSTIDLVGFTFSTLDNETLIFNPDNTGNVTATMGASVAAEADVLSAFSGHATIAAYIVHTGTHHYLEVAALTPGTGGTNTLVCGNGTADSNLGFTNTTSTTGKAAGIAAGVASVLSLPTTGLKVTFPGSSAYTKNEIHTAATTAPRHSQADMDAALAVYAAAGMPAGLLEIVQQPVDATDLVSYVEDLDTTIAGWEAQTSKLFEHYLVPAPVTASDASIRSALQLAGQSSRYGTVAAGDLYYTGISPGPKGSFRRSPCQALSARCANFSLSEDPGNGAFGPLPGVSMTGPDGVTKARDENTASVKLGTSKGPGFTVVGSIGGKPYFVRGVTRAGAGSLFVDLGVTRMVAYASSLVFAQLQGMQNPTFDLNPNGTITHADAAALVRAFEKALIVALVQAKHASSVVVAIDETENIAQTRNLTVTFTVQERGQGEDITVTMNLVGEIVTDGQLAAA